MERGGGGDLIRVVRTDTGFQPGAFGGAYRLVDVGELAAVLRVVEQRPFRAGLGGGFGEGAAGEATVAVRRDVLGPRLDAGVGDGFDVGGLRRDGDADAGILGDIAGGGGDFDRITRIRFQVHQDEHT